MHLYWVYVKKCIAVDTSKELSVPNQYKSTNALSLGGVLMLTVVEYRLGWG